ncbi:hypothetical protein BH23BAC3_BH23BAC3_33770 [soil metagenome]
MFKKQTLFIIKLLVVPLLLATGYLATHQDDVSKTLNEDRIQPLAENPYYWQYKDEPVFLIGGSWQDNLFNHPTNLEEHFDVMQSVGGNYVRNVMSHRNVGNVFAYEQDVDSLFDLDRWNDEYWNRFEHFLELTYNRDIIVQLEIWATWDLYEDHQSLGGWSFNPFNPENNITYSVEDSGMPSLIDYAPQTNPTDHPFFRTVTELENNELILRYQREYVDKILSYSLNYPHVLYTMNNETGEQVEWGDFWADYVRDRAKEAGTTIEITDMRRNEDIRSEDHAHILGQPERYTFLDISQNNAWSGLGKQHYKNILYIRERISDHPRPINNNKNYGAARHGEEESVARMGRILFGGAASARFHRPHPYEDPEYMEAKSDFGMGLSPRAQKIIQSISKVTEVLAFERTEPRSDLLHSDDEVYLLTEPGIQYAVYFPYGGSAVIDMGNSRGDFHYRWIHLDEGEWGNSGKLSASEQTEITTPDSGHWMIVIKDEF